MRRNLVKTSWYRSLFRLGLQLVIIGPLIIVISPVLPKLYHQCLKQNIGISD